MMNGAAVVMTGVVLGRGVAGLNVEFIRSLYLGNV